MVGDDGGGQAYTCSKFVQVGVVLLWLDRGPAVEDDVRGDFGRELGVGIGAVPAGIGIGPNIQLASEREMTDSGHDRRNQYPFHESLPFRREG